MIFDYTIDSPATAHSRLVLAHGAGASMQSDFMQHISSLLCERGIEVVRFNFAYMQTIQQTGKRRPPEKADKLLSHFKALLAHLENTYCALPLFIGGKSMGGRMATLLLPDSEARGAVVFGYPFHPPGKPEKLRTAHLLQPAKPVCILQGERDTFGTRAELPGFKLAATVQVNWLPDGDHSLKPRKASGYTYQANMQSAAEHAASFIHTHIMQEN